MSKMDLYRWKEEDVIEKLIVPSINRYQKRVLHIRHELGVVDEPPDFFSSLAEGMAYMTHVMPLMVWEDQNKLTGGLLDNFKDGRKNKKLIDLCNFTFSYR